MAKSADQIIYLKKDKALKKVIDAIGELKSKKDLDLYVALMRAIIGQQLSVKAANTIWNRFLDLFKDNYPAPKVVLKLKDDTLRSVGLSFQKAGYIKNIAQFSLNQSLEYNTLKNKSDDELIDYLIQIKGVGRWTVEMILMFNLNRLDVFPKDDLGIQNGMIDLYQIKHTSKKELFSQMEKIADSWRPYRTMACMYIWRHKDAVKNQ